MTSRKRSARKRQQEEFWAEAGGMDDAFARAEAERSAAEGRREAALREKSCGSKQRYDTRAEALDAIGRCAERGRRGLACYRCEWCGGWHLTSHSRA